MPTYYSVRRGHELELRPGGRGEVEDEVFGTRKVVFKPMKIRFTPLDIPFPVYGMPSRGGMAGGILTPEGAARQIRRAANELGSSPDKLPKSDEALVKWVTEKLDSHSALGSEFVKVPDADEYADGGAVMDGPYNAPPPGMAGPTVVGVIVRDETKGMAHCRVCNRSMASKGVNGHSRSKEHLANLKKAEQRLLAEQQAVAV